MLSNPRQSANVISRLFLTWTVPLFLKGYKKDLDIGDVYQPTCSDQSGCLGDRLEGNWSKEVKSTSPSLVGAVFRTFWKEYALLAVICAINDVVLRIGQPLLLGQLLLYFREDSAISYEYAMACATGLVCCIGCSAMLSNVDLFTAMRNAMKVRVAICSIIYRKSLRLSNTAFGETAPGKVVNLLSNDVARFDYASMLVNTMWTAPLLTIIVAILLWLEIGLSGLIGISIVFIVVPIQCYTGRLSSRLRMKMALRTDERIRFMDEIVCGVNVIKMYAWETPFAALIAMARKLELKYVRQTSHIRALYMTLMLVTTRMAVFCTMLSLALLYGANEITAAKVFVVSSYFSVLSHAMSQMFVRGVAEVSEALVAFKRLQHFLELEEKTKMCTDAAKDGLDHKPMRYAEKEDESLMPENVSVSLKNATAQWLSTSNGPHRKKKSSNKLCSEKSGMATPTPVTLDNVSVDFRKGQLIGVVGYIGSGKTSLLQAILRELPLQNGSIRVNGTVSYASQEPWLFGGTIRQNILFGQEYERDRYEAVVKACALTTDFEQLSNGDRMVIGERGTSLSGGQRARINLARAAYRQSDIYLLDDPLSAVDSHVGTHIFKKCLGPRGHLARLNATRILVTHQVHFLKEADWLVVLQEGKIIAQGTPSQVSKSGIDLVALAESEEPSENQEKPGRKFSRHFSRQLSTQSTSSIVDALMANEHDDNSVNDQLEVSGKARSGGAQAASYFRAGASWPTLLVLFVSFLLAQFLASFADFWVSVWTNYEEARCIHSAKMSQPKYCQPTYFMGIFELTTKSSIHVQGTILSCLFVLAIARSVGFYSICIKASQKLHDAMFNGMISTKTRFFDTNPCGRILNRFSKDIGAIDDSLPRVIFDATQIILNIIGVVAITAIVNPVFLVPVFFMAIVFVFIRKAYLKTSRSVKRLESNAKSPVFTHLAVSLDGLPTIRAYNAEQALIKQFDSHQDTHSACWFTYISTTSALGVSLNLLSFLFITCIIYVFMLFDTGISDDKIGLAITQAMTMTGLLQWGVRHSAEVSNQLMAVDRVRDYCDQEPEPTPAKADGCDKVWPLDGRIEFREVVYRYFAEADAVLRNLSFDIKPREKVGIVGRTGAGKSSLIGAIFRLACVEGEIRIDGVDTSDIPLDRLRSSIAIIPQDPVLFSGTLRRNLDPFGEYVDADIWSALAKVELKETSCALNLGLDTVVMARGSNFSVGQRQLICLARAILRKNRILVLDEATANVDPKTDLLIQVAIREQFADCTVLTIAHRLHTIIDSDRILVMDAGRATEFDEPHLLLQNNRGVFSQMVKTLGYSESKRLRQCALDRYNGAYYTE